MERLDLEKFTDKQIEKKKLKFILGGDTCTGGGGSSTPNFLGFNNTYLCDYWDSDSVDNCGNVTYSGYKKWIEITQ